MTSKRCAFIPVFLLAVVLLITTVPAPAATGDLTADRWAADYEQLGKWEFSGTSVPLPEGGVRLQRDSAEWFFESGTVCLMRPTSDGSVTGFEFEGHGWFRMQIPDPVEANQLSRYGVRTLGDVQGIADGKACSFQRVIVRTTDPRVIDLFPIAVSGYESSALAEQRHLWWLEHARFDADARIVAGLLNADSEYLAIDFESDDYGWLFYEFDPWRMEEIRLCRMRKAYDFVEVWISLDRTGHRRSNGRPGSTRTPLVDLVHAALEVDLMKHKGRTAEQITRGRSGGWGTISHGTGRNYAGPTGSGGSSGSLDSDHNRRDPRYPETRFSARMTFESQTDGLQALPLRLNPWAGAVTATDDEGRALPVLRAPIGQRFPNIIKQEEDTSLVVILHQPLAAGDSVVIDVQWERRTSNYPGRHDPYPVYVRPYSPYLAGGGQDWYPPLMHQSGRYWYPEPLEGGNDRHTARVTIVHPKSLRVRGTGRPAGSRSEGGRLITTWVTETPTKSAAFSYGHRYKERRLLLDGLPEVIAFGPNYWKNMGDETEVVAAYIADSIQYYQTAFDFSLPFETVTCTNVNGDSQPYSDLLALDASAFGFVDRWWQEKPMARLTAQLFWGEMLDWESYRDKWLCSALVEYSASMYLEAVGGVRGPRRERAINTNHGYFVGGWHIRPPSNAYRNLWVGPLDLGFRDVVAEQVFPVDSTNTWSYDVDGHRAVPSNVRRPYLRNTRKRTSVLHMLRAILRNHFADGDERFNTILADFLDTCAGKSASTRLFIAAVEHNTNEDWDWFFDQWVYGSDVPTYDWAHTLSVEPEEDGKYRLEIWLKQRDVPEGFCMPVTFMLEYEDADPELLCFVMDQPSMTHTVRLPNRPVTVTFDPYQDLLYVKEYWTPGGSGQGDGENE